VVNARQHYHRQRRIASNSARRIAEANGYNRMYPRVVWDSVHDERWTVEARTEAVHRLTRRFNPIAIRAEGCHWCEGRNHNTEQCTSIRQCLLCCGWGHSERKCTRPHALCGQGEICRVPHNHRAFRTRCRADIETFGA
jgi:hypothetical protein